MKTSGILIVEDESILAQDISDLLQGFGYSVLGIESNGTDAIKHVDEVEAELILMDVRLEGKIDGIDTAHAIKKKT